jgi:hypothetical protein
MINRVAIIFFSINMSCFIKAMKVVVCRKGAK